MFHFSFLLIAVKYKYNKYRGKLRVWIGLACLSALFAGVTAVLAKIGLKNVDSSLATALRTIIVLIFSWIMVLFAGTPGTIKIY